jgi:hypothetical protein
MPAAWAPLPQTSPNHERQLPDAVAESPPTTLSSPAARYRASSSIPSITGTALGSRARCNVRERDALGGQARALHRRADAAGEALRDRDIAT